MRLVNETSNKGSALASQPPPEESAAPWLDLQRSLANKLNISLVTLDGDDSIVGAVENDSSICRTMAASRKYAQLCSSDCGKAWSRAVDSKKVTEFRCHAGLSCFVTPIRIGENDMVVLGGRVFTGTSDYSDCVRRYSDLTGNRTASFLKDVKFTTASEFAEAENLVCAAASTHSVGASKGPSLRQLLDAHRYGERQTGKLAIIRGGQPSWQKGPAAEKLEEILRHVTDALDAGAVYQFLLAKLSELMGAARSSLMILNEQSNELTVEAALGFSADQGSSMRIKLGERVAGAVLARGTPLVVTDVDNDERVPGLRRPEYRTKSFISFPIAVGGRKLGVINFTDRSDGEEYNADDLSMVNVMAPHLALFIDRAEWRRKAEQFQQMSLTDALTGLPNRRYLQERLFEEVERSKRHNTPLSFMIIDIDHFKRYNDLYGHTSGDHVLIKTARMLRRSVRAIDMSARFAGDEFCIILPETEIEHAKAIAERLRREVANTDFCSEQGKGMGRVTISIGLSSFGGSRQSPLAIIESSDRSLYRAKTQGRNCVVAYSG